MSLPPVAADLVSFATEEDFYVASGLVTDGDTDLSAITLSLVSVSYDGTPVSLAGLTDVRVGDLSIPFSGDLYADIANIPHFRALGPGDTGVLEIVYEADDGTASDTGTVKINVSGVGDLDPPSITRISDDTGDFANDFLTNDTMLIFEGEAEPFSTVDLFADGALLGTTTADAAGAWRFDNTASPFAPTPTGQEFYEITLTARASNGSGTSAFSVPHVLQIDTVTPPRPIISGITPDTGESSTDGITSEPMVTIFGTSEPLNLVTVTALKTIGSVTTNVTTIGTVRADANGEWRIANPDPLDSGVTAFDAVARDSAGNETRPATSSIDRYIVQLDTQPPIVPSVTSISDDTGASSVDLVTKDRTLVFNGRAEPFNAIELSFIDPISGDLTPFGSTTADGTGAWTLDLTGQIFPEVVNQAVDIAATDVAGNASGGTTVITVDSTPPVQPQITGMSDDTGRSATDGITADQTIDVFGTAAPGSIVALYVTNPAQSLTPVLSMAVQTGSDGKWIVPAALGLPLSPGLNQFHATVVDLAGNEATSDPFDVVYDPNPAPAPALTAVIDDTGPAQDGTTSDGTLTFEGMAHPDSLVTVELDGVAIGTAQPTPLGTWSFDHTGTDLAEGVYAVDLTAESIAGVESFSQTTFILTVDKTAPAAPVVTGISDDTATPGDGVTTDDTLFFEGTAEAGSFVGVFLDGTPIGGTQADAQGAWRLDHTATVLPAGQYAVTAQAMDLAGNMSAVSGAFAVEILPVTAAAPRVTGIAPDSGFDSADGITNATRLVFLGTAPSGATVELTLDGSVIGQAQADALGVWRFDHTGTALARGGHDAIAVILGPNGARSAPSQPYGFEVDTAPPATPAAPDLAAVSDSGVSDSDNITATQGLIFSTTSEAGALVTLSSDLDGTLASGIVAPDGTITFSGINLTEGVHDISARAEDAAGNLSGSSVATQVTVDRTPPAPNVPDGLSWDLERLPVDRVVSGTVSGGVFNGLFETPTDGNGEPIAAAEVLVTLVSGEEPGLLDFALHLPVAGGEVETVPLGRARPTGLVDPSGNRLLQYLPEDAARLGQTHVLVAQDGFAPGAVEVPVTETETLRQATEGGEPVTGTDGDDVFLGTDGDDLFVAGGVGADLVDAGAGTDELVLPGSEDEWRAFFQADGSLSLVRVTAPEAAGEAGEPSPSDAIVLAIGIERVTFDEGGFDTTRIQDWRPGDGPQAFVGGTEPGKDFVRLDLVGTGAADVIVEAVDDGIMVVIDGAPTFLGFSGIEDLIVARDPVSEAGGNIAFVGDFSEILSPNSKLVVLDNGDNVFDVSTSSISYQVQPFDGNDTIRLGLGWDLVYNSYNTPIRELLGLPLIRVQGDKTLDGGPGPDTLGGSDGADSVHGGDGDDFLTGNGGADTLVGGENDDLIEGGGDNDNLDGGPGDDEITGGQGDDTLNGGGGDDLLDDPFGRNILDGGSGNDTLGAFGNDNIYIGGPGSDAFIANNHSGAGGSATVRDFEPGSAGDGIIFASVRLVQGGTGAPGPGEITLSLVSAPGGGTQTLVTWTEPGSAVAPIAMLLDGDFSQLTPQFGSRYGGTFVTLIRPPVAADLALTVSEDDFISGTSKFIDLGAALAGSISDPDGVFLGFVDVDDAPNRVGSYSAPLTAPGSLGNSGSVEVFFDFLGYILPNVDALALGDTAQGQVPYMVTDVTSTSTANITLTVTGANDAPGANDYGPNKALKAPVSVGENSTTELFEGDFGTSLRPLHLSLLGSDVDRGDTVTVTHLAGVELDSVTPAADGSRTIASQNVPGAAIIVRADGTLAYRAPEVDAPGVGGLVRDDVRFTVRDTLGLTDTGTLFVEIVDRNTPPDARNDAYVVSEDAIPPMALLDVLSNDADPDPTHKANLKIDSVAFASGSAATGTASVAASGTRIEYDFPGDFGTALHQNLGRNDSGSVQLEYVAVDPAGVRSDPALVDIRIEGRNDAPFVTADPDTIGEGSELNFRLIDLFATLGDPDDGDVLTVTIEIPAAAAAAIGGIRALNTLSAGVTATGLGTEKVTLTTPSNSSENLLPELLNLGFSLPADIAGTLPITVTVGDGLETATATTTLTLTNVNDPVQAVDDALTATEDTPTDLVVTANDVDPDDLAINDLDGSIDDPLTITGIAPQAGAQGLYTIRPDGRAIGFDPNGAFDRLKAGETTTETIAYTLTDAGGEDAFGNLVLTITGVDDPVNAIDDNLGPVLPADGVLSFDFKTLTDNDIDADDVLSLDSIFEVAGQAFSAATLPAAIPLAGPTGPQLSVDASGQATIDANGAFTALAQGQRTSFAFDYAVQAGLSNDTASVVVVVEGVNDAPVAVDDGFATDADTLLSANVFASGSFVDFDPDTGDTFTVTKVNGDAASVGQTLTTALGARLEVRADGTLFYDPRGVSALGALGAGDPPVEDVFTYEITDTHGGTDTAEVRIAVAGANDDPIALADTIDVADFGSTQVAAAAGLLANDTDPDTSDAAGLRVAEVFAATNGLAGTTVSTAAGATLTIAADGSLIYDPGTAFAFLEAGQTGTDSAQYRITDGNNGFSTASIDFLVAGSNQAPAFSIVNQVTAVPETALPGTLILEVQASDPEGPATLALEDPTGLFAFDGGRVVIAPGKSLDFETETRHSVVMTATDTDGDTSQLLFTFDVTDVTEETRQETLADGVVRETILVDGVRNTTTMTDVENARSWVTSNTFFDAGGARTRQAVLYDDGRVSETLFVDGIRSAKTTSDPENSRGWLETFQAFDEAGQPAARTTTYDDGRISETLFVDGVRSAKTTSDPENSRGWLETFQAFDEAGKPAARTTTYDDGRISETLYVDGIRSAKTTSDPENSRGWLETFQAFDEAGKPAARTTTYDDGRISETLYVDGIRTERTQSDPSDVKNWTTIVTVFDTDGEAHLRTTTWDDGTLSTKVLANRAPEAINDQVQWTADDDAIPNFALTGPLATTFAVLENDTDLDGDPLQIKSFSQAFTTTLDNDGPIPCNEVWVRTGFIEVGITVTEVEVESGGTTQGALAFVFTDQLRKYLETGSERVFEVDYTVEDGYGGEDTATLQVYYNNLWVSGSFGDSGACGPGPLSLPAIFEGQFPSSNYDASQISVVYAPGEGAVEILGIDTQDTRDDEIVYIPASGDEDVFVVRFGEASRDIVVRATPRIEMLELDNPEGGSPLLGIRRINALEPDGTTTLAAPDALIPIGNELGLEALADTSFSLTLSGVPDGFDFTLGDLDGEGNVRIEAATPADLASLAIIPPTDFAGVIGIDAQLLETDGDVAFSDRLFFTVDDSADPFLM